MSLKVRKGSIIIVSLLVMLMVFMMAAFSQYMTTIQNGIQSAVEDRIQAHHEIENAVNRLLYYERDGELPDSFKYMIYDAMKAPNTVIFGEWTDEKSGLLLDTEIKYLNQNIELKLSADEEVFGTPVSVEVLGSCSNPVFLRNDPIISPEVLSVEEEEILDESLQSFEGFILLDKVLPVSYIDQMNSFNDILIKSTAYRKYAITKTKGLYSEVAYLPNPTNVLYISAVENPDGTQPRMIIDFKSNLYMPGSKGIIFVEGDLEIISNLKFNGIIIVKDGDIVIRNNAAVSISGMVVASNILSLDPSLVKRAEDLVGQFIFHIPGYFRHEVKSIKIY